jgi:hypothetical protein
MFRAQGPNNSGEKSKKAGGDKGNCTRQLLLDVNK